MHYALQFQRMKNVEFSDYVLQLSFYGVNQLDLKNYAFMK